MDLLIQAAALLMAAVTAYLNSQGRNITAQELGAKADGYFNKAQSDLKDDEKHDQERMDK